MSNNPISLCVPKTSPNFFVEILISILFLFRVRNQIIFKVETIPRFSNEYVNLIIACKKRTIIY